MRPLDLVEKFITGLSVEAIPYCHWKSNTNIEASLRGETDLDLLVASQCRESCLALLDKLGFYQASNPWDLDLPGISHYFGYDRPSGRLVHVHLHFQLILGEDLLKNYQIPVEKAFFDSATTIDHIAVPSHEVEFIVFVLRMVLKRRLLSFAVRMLYLMGNTRSLLKQLVGFENPQLSPGAQAEFDDLRGKISEETLLQTLRCGFPFVSPDLFRRCRNSLADTADRFAWLTVGHQLAKALSDYRRLTGVRAAGKMIWQGFKLRVRAVLTKVGCRCVTGKVPRNGGRIIVFFDNDGTGANALADDSAQWLGSFFSVARLRLDKPAKGALWTALSEIRALLAGKTYQPPDPIEDLCLHKIDRNAIRLRQRGMLVLLNGTLLPQGGDLSHGCAVGRTGEKESSWFQRNNIDVVIVLPTDQTIAPSEGNGGGKSNRSTVNLNRHWSGTAAHFVDPAKPMPEILFQVRSLLWECIGKERREF